ncbi:hypothetical protein BsIDN1_70240 [Bacillus safensis]|uniref:Uncharacterized protein n=1 Tax=Bacillus safensis TaxID=561879 RepID=A0A5S9MNR8_BACIA|nr:hypothetical protein BsIDN1_70240 [Bacillus safensis]
MEHLIETKRLSLHINSLKGQKQTISKGYSFIDKAWGIRDHYGTFWMRENIITLSA